MTDPAATDPTPTDPTAASDDGVIDTGMVRELAGILRDTDLTSIEVERGPLRIRVAREVAPAPATPVYAQTPAAPPPVAEPSPAAVASSEPARPDGALVKSPMVGTVYLQPQPGSEPFVRVGQAVSEGQTVVIIEAMKTMNPVAAPRAGTLVELLIGDGQPVEYGQPLAVIA